MPRAPSSTASPRPPAGRPLPPEAPRWRRARTVEPGLSRGRGSCQTSAVMRAMRGRGYRGGFDHPLRAFVVGMGLLVVIVVGFVVGVDVGGIDSSQDATVTRHVRTVRTVVVAAAARTGARSAPRYVVIDHVRWRVVRVHAAPPARPGGGTRLRLVAVPPAESPDRTVVVTVTTPSAGSTHEEAASPPATL